MMPSNPFIQIHFLTSYPGTLLNRDDAGFAKRMPFGGVTRTRVSSQSLKRHWRLFKGEHSLSELDQPRTLRSRFTFELRVAQPLIAEGLHEGAVRAVVQALLSVVLGAKEDKGSANATQVQSAQITVLGEPEVDYIAQLARQILAQHGDAIVEQVEAAAAAEAEGADAAKKSKPKKGAKASDIEKKVRDLVDKAFDKPARANLLALKNAAGLDAALFGRMVTGDILSRGDAAIHVAHALTVHAEASESDYFSAVDDLLPEVDGESGSGHINSSELTSGLFYGYVVVDVPLLVSNLTGCKREEWEAQDRELAALIVERLVYLIATVSPGAKLGSTAPYSYASMVMVEAGRAQPRTLANAFERPVKESPDRLGNTYRALAEHLGQLHAMYGKRTQVSWAGLGAHEPMSAALGQDASGLYEVAQWAAEQVRGSR
jgi:CRISPR system Cascade subunit CasC